MARAGITYNDVANAAIQLQGEGKNPTADRIREVLGTGSKSTVVSYLQQWRARQLNIPEELLHTLPQELLALVVGLWKQMNEMTDTRMEAHQHESQKEVDFIKAAFIQLQDEKSTLEAELKQQTDKNQILRLENADLGSAIRHEQQEHMKLRDRYTSQSQQLEEAKAKNKDLLAVVERFQANLEHYQEANQELHLRHSLALEKQQGEFQRERIELLQQIHVYQEQKQALETELTVKIEGLKSYETLQEEHRELVEKYFILQREFAIHQEQSHQLEKTCQQQAQLLQEKTEAEIALKKQITLSSERLLSLMENLNQTKALVFALKEEKRELLQLIKSIKVPAE